MAKSISVKGARDANTDLFRISSMLEDGKSGHYPFIVITKTAKTVEVNIVEDIQGAMIYPLTSTVLWQWGGQWRSDFFSLTVKELKRAYKKYRGE